jgi:hypothetical protein
MLKFDECRHKKTAAGAKHQIFLGSFFEELGSG